MINAKVRVLIQEVADDDNRIVKEMGNFTLRVGQGDKLKRGALAFINLGGYEDDIPAFRIFDVEILEEKEANILWKEKQAGLFKAEVVSQTEWDAHHGTENDPIDRPSHYTRGKIEPYDFVDSQNLNFAEACIVKYITRYKFKGKPLKDLKKARWYLNKLIEKYELNKS